MTDIERDSEEYGTPINVPVPEPGQILKGQISKIDGEHVYVSAGFKSEGRIPKTEFLNRDNEMTVAVKDEIEVMVTRVDEEDIFLSFKNVVIKRRWDELERKFKDHEPAEGRILRAVKGGYKVDMGVNRHGFLPASHLGMQNPKIETLLDKNLPFHVIEFSRENENIVLSHREFIEKERKHKESEAFAALKENDVIEGKVTRLTGFGAFVDLGGIEGLVHVSEISWDRVGHPNKALKTGETARVRILKVDPEKRKISLSIKQVSGDPWNDVDIMFHIDQAIEGAVTKIMKFGVFVRLADGVEGLLHVSELGAPGETNVDPQKVCKAGSKLNVKILNIEKDKRKISLALDSQGRAKTSKMAKYLDGGGDAVTLGDMMPKALRKAEKQLKLAAVEPAAEPDPAPAPASAPDAPEEAESEAPREVGQAEAGEVGEEAGAGASGETATPADAEETSPDDSHTKETAV